jgi:hypothetical protein
LARFGGRLRQLLRSGYTYPPFDFNGDLIECDPDDPSKCTSQPASFIMPLELAL